MTNKYSTEKRAEAFKLIEEIGSAATARRLGMNLTSRLYEKDTKNTRQGNQNSKHLFK